MLHKVPKIVAVVGLLALLAACSPTASQSGSSGESVAESGSTESITAGEAVEISVVGHASPPSFPLLRMMDAGTLGNNVTLNFDKWANFDQLSSAATGDADAVVAPLNTGATLYNKGVDLQLLDTSAWAVMGLVTRDDSIQSIDDLKGKTISVAMQSSAVDFTTQLILKEHGLVNGENATINYVDLTEGPAQFIAGSIDTIVIVEPVITTMESKVPNARSIVDFQSEWEKFTGQKEKLPTAGIFVTGAFTKDHPELIDQFQTAYEDAAQWIGEHPEEAAQLVEKYLEMPAAVMNTALPKIDAEARSAQDSKKAVSLYFEKIFELTPDSVGGQMPDDNFYYQ